MTSAEIMKCFTRQARREANELAYILADLEKHLDAPDNDEFFSLADYASELQETRKFFNQAYRALLKRINSQI